MSSVRTVCFHIGLGVQVSPDAFFLSTSSTSLPRSPSALRRCEPLVREPPVIKTKNPLKSAESSLTNRALYEGERWRCAVILYVAVMQGVDYVQAHKNDDTYESFRMRPITPDCFCLCVCCIMTFSSHLFPQNMFLLAWREGNKNSQFHVLYEQSVFCLYSL